MPQRLVLILLGLWSGLVVATISSCTAPRVSRGRALSRVTRMEAIAIAESYVHHPWTPSRANVRHGLDPLGIRVDTPDASYQDGIPGWWIPGIPTTSIPYQWGGFCTPAQFDQGLAQGLAAGDVYTAAKRSALDSAVSRYAVGIDCSGFVSRCWKLPRSYSTRELPQLCERIEWDALQPGDLLNTHNAHCLLFGGWENGVHSGKLWCYEVGCPPSWQTIHHLSRTSYLMAEGYTAWRYRGMRD